MKIISLFIVLSVSAFFSCSFHQYTKGEALKVAKKRALKKDGGIVIEDDNKILKVLTRDSNYQKLDEIYQFDDNGKQVKYTLIASCDSCFQKYLLKITTYEAYKWKKLNDSTYLSKYNLKRVLNIHRSTYSYDVVKYNQSKKEYKLSLKKAGQ